MTAHATLLPPQVSAARRASCALRIPCASPRTGGMGLMGIRSSLFEGLVRIRRGLRRNARVIVLLVSAIFLGSAFGVGD